jgi:Small metal-binding protein
MNMKNITLLASLFIMAIISFSAIAEDTPLDQAIQHAQAAATSSDSKAVVQHATEAIMQATAAIKMKPIAGRYDKNEDNHVSEGLKCLDDAVKEGNAGHTDAAKKAASDAVNHFKQAANIK